MSEAKRVDRSKRHGTPPACIGCGRRLPSNRPRAQLPNGAWVCPDCLYRRDHPDAPRIVRHKAPREPQSERLPL